MNLNNIYLEEITKLYDVNKIELCDKLFDSYCVSAKKDKIYLMLCNSFDTIIDSDEILSSVSLIDKGCKNGCSYLCVAPMDNPSIESCMFFNGKSFVHFIFYDISSNKLVYSKKFYYHGGKRIKQLIDLYQNCFCRINK